jgi:hypothetical protein
MCCQDGNAAIRQMLNEPAGWSAEAEGSFFMQGQPACEELPTAAAELVITLVPVQDGEAVAGAVPPGQELPTAAAELIITLVPVQGEAVAGAVPPGPSGGVP